MNRNTYFPMYGGKTYRILMQWFNLDIIWKLDNTELTRLYAFLSSPARKLLMLVLAVLET